jgi:putative salt-induced outer membrane protein YdiY
MPVCRLLAPTIAIVTTLVSTALAQSGPTLNPAYSGLQVPPASGAAAELLPSPSAPLLPGFAAESPPVEPIEAETIELSVAEPSEVVEPVVAHWYMPRYWLQPPGWNSGIELGLNGSSGTSESTSIRVGGYMKRKSDRRKVDIELYHNRTQAQGVSTQNNAQFKARHDWLTKNSPWSVYVLNQVFFDEFQAFDYNVNINTGIGYAFIDTDPMKLSGSLGSGASREFGGPDDEWVPEAQFGMEYEHKLVANRRFYAKVDYFPEWENFSSYRILADIGWEIELLQPSNMSLKLSATDRYDGDPQGVNPHNLNYSAMIIWKL